MAFYGSLFSNDTSANRRFERHARHIACPQRLKYIHDVKDGYIPYVEDSRLSSPTKVNRIGLYNTADAWRQELMGLAQQVQSSFDESRSARLTHRSRKRNDVLISNSFNRENQFNEKKLLTNRSSSQSSHLIKPKISVDENLSNKNQDSGIWLLPILCYILQVDNIFEAQQWLLNANLTEKRLAMELIRRTMQDMQNLEGDFHFESVVSDQSSSINNLYWPYKFWQHQQQQQQSKLTMDSNDTCERATSPVRFLTPAKRSSASTSSILENRYSTASRLITPTLPSFSPRRSHRITTSRSMMTDIDSKSIRGKTPLV